MPWLGIAPCISGNDGNQRMPPENGWWANIYGSLRNGLIIAGLAALTLLLIYGVYQLLR